MGADLDEATWVEVRYEFEYGTLPVRRVASMYGISYAAIYDRAAREAWTLRSERGRRGSGLPRGRRVTRPAETHEERHQRFYRIIDRLLEKMEIGADIGGIVQALAGTIGTLMTLYGRARATVPLVRRDVSVKL